MNLLILTIFCSLQVRFFLAFSLRFWPKIKQFLRYYFFLCSWFLLNKTEQKNPVSNSSADEKSSCRWKKNVCSFWKIRASMFLTSNCSYLEECNNANRHNTTHEQTGVYILSKIPYFSLHLFLISSSFFSA